MKVHYLKSATTIVESKGVKILTDPWLIDGEYYGSWFHYPPFEFDPKQFDDVDFIYISHIHPDHFSRQTLSQLSREIPVLIHNFQAKFLKRNIEALGFEVRELDHNVRTHLKNDVHINILAADNCNPELCGKFFGCGQAETKFGSSQIDSLSIIDDGKFNLLNVNDCPLALAKHCAVPVKETYEKIDMMLVGYAGAGPYPQCFSNLSTKEKTEAANKKKNQFLKQGLGYLELFLPKHYMPFAGTYTLGGSRAELNGLRGVPEREDALEYFAQNYHGEGVLLNSNSFIDLETGELSIPYAPVDRKAKQRYIENEIAPRPYLFEENSAPTKEDFEPLIPVAFDRMNEVRTSINFESKTKVVIPVGNGEAVFVSMDGTGWNWAAEDQADELEAFTKFSVDPRLLFNILRGPRFGHWNNAEIGSHIEFYRKPDVFERGLNYCMNFFFAG